MSEEIKKYKRGERLTYSPTMQTVWVMHNTLKAGGVNSDEATIWVFGKKTGLISIPVARQDDFLETYKPLKGDDENDSPFESEAT